MNQTPFCPPEGDLLSSVAPSRAIVHPVDPAAADKTAEAARCTLFFDGICGLCNKSVDFVLSRDVVGAFQFAPLQGATARQLLPPADVADLSSVVLLVEGRAYRQSSAAVRILWRLSLGWKVLGTLLWLVPLPLRDLGYRLIARNRYRLFGKHETCRMPTSAERTRFLP